MLVPFVFLFSCGYQNYPVADPVDQRQVYTEEMKQKQLVVRSKRTVTCCLTDDP